MTVTCSCSCSQACSHSCSHLYLCKWLQEWLQEQLQVAVYHSITVLVCKWLQAWLQPQLQAQLQIAVYFFITIPTSNEKTHAVFHHNTDKLAKHHGYPWCYANVGITSQEVFPHATPVEEWKVYPPQQSTLDVFTCRTTRENIPRVYSCIEIFSNNLPRVCFHGLYNKQKYTQAWAL